MTTSSAESLSRREREIMDIVYAHEEASAAEVQAAMSDPPSYSAVRGLLRILEEKGQLCHRKVGVRNVYRPTRGRQTAGRSAMRRALDTFFGGELDQALVALLDARDRELGPAEVRRLKQLIEAARKEGR